LANTLISIGIELKANNISVLAIELAIIIARIRIGIRSGRIRKKLSIIRRPGGLLQGGEITLNCRAYIIQMLKRAGVKLTATSF